jgi:hypothetical protein
LSADAAGFQALTDVCRERLGVRIQWQVIAELVQVLFRRLLQAQFGHVEQQHPQLGVPQPCPVRLDFLLPVGPLLPVITADLVDGGTHIANNKIRTRQAVVVDGLLHQVPVAACHIGQRDFRTCDKRRETAPRALRLRLRAVRQDGAVKIRTQ